MTCQQLAAWIEDYRPGADSRDVARLCLLLCNAVERLDDLQDQRRFAEIWRDVGLRLQAATDQHAAMTEELDSLARTDPQRFSPEQIWILVRAIKVQSQLLELYVGSGLPAETHTS